MRSQQNCFLVIFTIPILLFISTVLSCAGITSHDLEGVWYSKKSVDYIDWLEVIEYRSDCNFDRYLYQDSQPVEQQSGEWDTDYLFLESGVTGALSMQFPFDSPPSSALYHFFYDKELKQLFLSDSAVLEENHKSPFDLSDLSLIELIKKETGHDITE